MVTVGFFAVGGRQWSPFAEVPQLIPDARFFEVANSTSEACRECLRTETRCAALLDPWKSECRALVDGTTVAQTSDCEVKSFVGAAKAPEGTPLIPALAACSTVCTAPHMEVYPNYASGYSRPFLSLT